MVTGPPMNFFCGLCAITVGANAAINTTASRCERLIGYLFLACSGGVAAPRDARPQARARFYVEPGGRLHADGAALGCQSAFEPALPAVRMVLDRGLVCSVRSRRHPFRCRTLRQSGRCALPRRATGRPEMEDCVCNSVRVLVALVAAVVLPSVAFAQATIAGVVRDSSGAVLPGVTVEAASPALTEKVRTVVTDGSGQYRIVTLPPGRYNVKFTLTGFTIVQRDDVTVSGSGVIPINADLRVGTLQETITVSGESPLVDTQTTRRETVIDSETINALPITRNYGGVLYATPGLVVQPGVNANALQPSMALFSAHGGISTEGRVFVDGVSVNGPFGQNSVTQFAFDVGNAQEMQVMVGGGLGESETGGPVANIIP